MALDVRDISKGFGGVEVVREVSIRVGQGEIVGLIGPNGAGKTTLFDIISGATAADHGYVHVFGQGVTGMSSDQVAQAGLIRTYQVPRLFWDLSVMENCLVGGPRQSGESFASVWLHPRRIRREEASLETRAWAVLDRLNLSRVANDLASTLSGGQQKLLELGRSLMAEPSLLLLDEPVAGVAPKLAVEIRDTIRGLRQEGLTILVIEHKMDFVMSLCDRLYVMATGSVIAEGSPMLVRQDPAVLKAYLGE